jgi:N-methylhydantoinase B
LVRAFSLREGTATASVLAERHTVHPRGANGGGDGGTGHHERIRADGTRSTVPAKATLDLLPGDTLVIQTAGGGGSGDPALRDSAAIARDRANGIDRT